MYGNTQWNNPRWAGPNAAGAGVPHLHEQGNPVVPTGPSVAGGGENSGWWYYDPALALYGRCGSFDEAIRLTSPVATVGDVIWSPGASDPANPYTDLDCAEVYYFADGWGGLAQSANGQTPYSTDHFADPYEAFRSLASLASRDPRFSGAFTSVL